MVSGQILFFEKACVSDLKHPTGHAPGRTQVPARYSDYEVNLYGSQGGQRFTPSILCGGFRSCAIYLTWKGCFRGSCKEYLYLQQEKCTYWPTWVFTNVNIDRRLT